MFGCFRNRHEIEAPYERIWQPPLNNPNNRRNMDLSDLKRELSVARENNILEDQLNILEDLGVAYQKESKHEEAKNCHRESVRIAIAVQDRRKEGRAYGNLGKAYHNQCNFRLAIRYHEKSLKIARQENDNDAEGLTLCNLGNAYYSLGELETAASCYQESLEIFSHLSYHKNRPRAVEGNLHDNLGNVLLAQGKYDEAKKQYKMARKIATKLKDFAATGRSYNNSGNLYLKKNEYGKAKEKYRKALKLAKRGKNKDWRGIGCAKGNLSWVCIYENKMQEARKSIAKCLQIAKDHNDSELEANAKCHRGFIEEKEGNLMEAKRWYGSSLELFNDMRTELQSNYEWKISLREKYQRVYQAHWNVLLELNEEKEALLAVDRGRAQALDDQLISSDGGDAERSSHRGVSERDLAKFAKPAVVYCAVRGDDVHIWLIQQTGVHHVRKSTSESLQSDTDKLIESMNSYNYKDGQKSQSLGNNFVDAGSSCEAALKRLYDITVGQVDHLLRQNELTIVPDGPLNFAPFSAFLMSRLFKPQYLSEFMTIRLAPSLFTLKLIQNNETGNNWKGALIVGDPCMKRTLLTKNGERLKQLDKAKEEAEMVAKLFNAEPLIREKATKGEVLRRLGTVSLVHIAAHGSPETGEIALTPDLRPDDKHLTYEDCLLTMKDVSSTPSKARLVVLSCCDSGHGNVRAEGVIGIARAFLQAGAHSVLATLWDIDDEATMMFMKFFYEKLVDGERASVALQCALNSLRRTKEYNTVNYWAPFVLIGDDITIHVK